MYLLPPCYHTAHCVWGARGRLQGQLWGHTGPWHGSGHPVTDIISCGGFGFLYKNVCLRTALVGLFTAIHTVHDSAWYLARSAEIEWDSLVHTVLLITVTFDTYSRLSKSILLPVDPSCIYQSFLGMADLSCLCEYSLELLGCRYQTKFMTPKTVEEGEAELCWQMTWHLTFTEPDRKLSSLSSAAASQWVRNHHHHHHLHSFHYTVVLLFDRMHIQCLE